MPEATFIQLLKTIFTARNSSCGKVMFSQTHAMNSVHGGGVSQHAMGRGSVHPTR